MDKIVNILNKFNVDVTQNLLSNYKQIENKVLKTPRQIAQIVGTEVLRAAGDEDIHCKNVELGSDITIVSDIRFPNEFFYFNKTKGINFLPFYIHRKEAEDQITENSHPSETSVFMFCDKCIYINNNGSLQELKDQLNKELFSQNIVLKENNL